MTIPRKPGLFRRLTEALFEESRDHGTAEIETRPTAVVTPSEPEAEPLPVQKTIGPASDQNTVIEPAFAVSPPEPRRRPATDVELMAIKVTESQARFEARLQTVIEEKPRGCAGKLQMLDLEDIKARFGDAWESMAERALGIAEQVIRRRLAPSDVVAPLSDHSFVVLFAELTEDQAALKAAAIAREVRDRLLGELGVSEKYWVRAFVTEVKPDEESPPGSVPATTLAQLESRFAQAENLAAPPGEPRLEPEIARQVGEVGALFRAIWFLPKGAITTYACRLQRLDNSNHLLAGTPAYPRGADRTVLYEIDRLLLTKSLRALRRLIDSDRRVLINLPIHVTSLLDLAGAKLIDQLRAVPEGARRLITIQFIGLMPTAPLARLSDVIGALQPFTRTFSARVPLGFGDFDRLARLGVGTAVIDLEDNDTPPLGLGALNQLVRSVHNARMTLSLSGVQTREQANVGAAARVDFLSGPGIVGDKRHLTAAHTFQLS